MARIDPKLAVALLINEKWNVTLNSVASSLPGAIDTIMWGYKSGDLKEVMVHTGFLEEDHARPQIGVEEVEDRGRGAINGIWADVLVRANVWVPRRYTVVTTLQALSTLKNWAYQMAMEVERIAENSVGTVLNDSSNDDYSIPPGIDRIPEPDLLPGWFAYQVIIPLSYIS